MLPIQITLTPTMVTFENLEENVAENIEHGEVKINEHGKYYVKGDEKTLFKLLLELSYNYDIEIG